MRRHEAVVWTPPDPGKGLLLAPTWTLGRALRQTPRDLARSSNFCLLFLINHTLAGASLFCLLFLQSRRLAALFFSFPVWFSLSALGLPPAAQLAAYVAYFVLIYFVTT